MDSKKAPSRADDSGVAGREGVDDYLAGQREDLLALARVMVGSRDEAQDVVYDVYVGTPRAVL